MIFHTFRMMLFFSSLLKNLPCNRYIQLMFLKYYKNKGLIIFVQLKFQQVEMIFFSFILLYFLKSTINQKKGPILT